MEEERLTDIETAGEERIGTEAVSHTNTGKTNVAAVPHANAVEPNETTAYAVKMISGRGEASKNEPSKPGRIDTVRKALSVIGCVLMLLSILFPFLRMTEPNGAVTEMTRRETFALGMPGWDAGPYILWALIAISCVLILVFQFRNQRKKARHGCRIALLIVIFDVLTIAGFVAQYGPDEITFFPLAGFWLLAAGCLLTWVASFLHKRKKKPKKNRKGKSRRKNQGYLEMSEDPDAWESESGEDGADRMSTPEKSEKSGKKLYRDIKKQQKLEREERMKKMAEKREEEREK